MLCDIIALYILKKGEFYKEKKFLMVYDQNSCNVSKFMQLSHLEFSYLNPNFMMKSYRRERVKPVVYGNLEYQVFQQLYR